MLTEDQNEQLTRVGRGTPMGELLRRYWHPIAAASEMRDRPTKRVRLLGEDLVLFRDRTGGLGLIAEQCPHRRASFAYGIPTERGIRCPYHGWEYDAAGTCLEQPNEPADSTFRTKVPTAGYPVQTLAGMLWAYLGPAPAPLIPRLDGYFAAGAIKLVGRAVVRANWLQIMENSMDPVHAEWLHGHLQEFVDGAHYTSSRKHIDIGFTEFEYGIYKRRLREGQALESDDWRIGHPIVFPLTLYVGSADAHMRMHSYQIRVPIDDETTLHYWYYAFVPPPWADVPQHLYDDMPLFDVKITNEHGEYNLDLIDGQDVMAWETQGRIADRTRERLGWTDQGLPLWRRLLLQEYHKLQAGEDPMGVLRAPRGDEVIELHSERNKVGFSEGFASLLRRMPMRDSPIANELLAVFAPRTERAEGVSIS